MTISPKSKWTAYGMLPKLLVIFLLFSFSMAALLLWVMTSSFDAGLLNYVNKREQAQINRLVDALQQYYTEQNGWHGLRGNGRQWRVMMDYYLFGIQHWKPPPHTKPHRKDGRRKDKRHKRPPPGAEHVPPGSLYARIRLIDQNEEWVAGPKHSDERAERYELRSKQQLIGWLLVGPTSILTGEFELEFKASQQRWLWLALVLLFFISALLAWTVAKHFLIPVKTLAEGTRALSQGEFGLQLNSNRSDELGDLVQQFNHLSRTLDASKIDRDRWVADIAHELRTPLSVLQGEIGALLDGTRDISEGALQSLADEVKMLTRLVQDLYELSLSDLGGLSYRFQQVNLDNLLDSIMESFQSTAKDKGLELSLTSSLSASLGIQADPDRLVQLLNNLISNSLRYTTAPGRIQLSAYVREGDLVMTIDDTAPSVSPIALPRLFERLYREEESRTRTGGGAGLGLSICQNIVKAHKGTIKASDSNLGGLQVEVSLPLVHD